MIDRAQAVRLLEGGDLIAVAMEAAAVRQRLHPDRIVSYPAMDAEPCSEPILFDPDETNEQHVERLERVRQAQIAAGAFTAVLPHVDGTAVEYLKLLALSRIYLENIPHIQTSWTLGLKICQIALRFGADDIAGPADGAPRPTEEQLRYVIRDAGFIPKARDALFRSYFLD
jgi:cyclic dehypoxanthinyl futalosine synthase